MPKDTVDRLRTEVQEALEKIAVFPRQSKARRNVETQARTLRSLLRIAKKTMETNDPTVDKDRLAALIAFLERETKKEKPSEAVLEAYLREEVKIFKS